MIERYERFFNFQELVRIRKEQEESLLRISHWDTHRERLRAFEPPAREELQFQFGDVVSVRGSTSAETVLKKQLGEIIEGLLPWRKGPFDFLGHEVDAEWCSNRKWDRLAGFLPPLRGKRIADVGANNGYFMFRLLEHDPQLILGLDPSSRCFYQFELFQRFLRDERLGFELLGIEHLDIFPEFFDCVFCLGVIYHRRDPYTSCRMLFESMRSDGTLFFESLVWPGDESFAFCVPDRYAKMRNVWYIPTVTCMQVWLEKAGFTNVEVISTERITTEEQRQTRLAPYESLADFLDPTDPSKTIEGYPAPTRSILKAYRP